MQDLSEDYQKLQAGKAHRLSWEAWLLLIFRPELSTAVEARQQLESQQQENTTVQKVRSEEAENMVHN